MAYDRTKRLGEREGWSKNKITTDAKTAYNTAKDMYNTHWAVWGRYIGGACAMGGSGAWMRSWGCAPR